MAESFHASFLKIERAKQHISELEKQAEAYLSDDPVSFETAVNQLDRSVRFQMNSKPIPDIMSAIIGDIFHNLRSSLDLMASELCRIISGNDDGVYFPFANSADELGEMIKRRNFDRAGPKSVALLNEFRPYKGGNLALRAIHDLNIRDKHQMLIANAFAVASPIVDTSPGPEGGLKIVGDPSKPTDVKLVFPAHTGLDGREILPTLHELVEMTTGIVEAFKRLTIPPH